MNLTQKIQLLSILPLMVAMFVVAFVNQNQFEKLSQETADAYKESVIASRQQELKNYTSLALSSIEHLYSDQRLDDAVSQQLVNSILSNLEYGEDGYFFAYNQRGDGLVHPKQHFRVGENWWNLQDPDGKFLIRELIYNAQSGGDFLQYQWEKPSSGEVAKKMAYSVLLDRWGWMLGTGIYIDDVDRQIAAIQGDIDQKIKDTSFVTLVIALIAFGIVFISGLFLQFNERKLADEKLQELTKRILTTQEEERRRVSRELHDGISQLIASAKFSLETAAVKIKNQQEPDKDIALTQERISQTLQDLRRISRDLHPRVLDDHGLSAAIEALARGFADRTGVELNLNLISVRNLLPVDVKTTLYRVAQEALTNIERHAEASAVEITIDVKGQWVVFSIADDGKGFDVPSLTRSKSPTVGIGLRNMQERISYHKGLFSIESDKKGTRLEARIPKSTMKFNAK